MFSKVAVIIGRLPQLLTDELRAIGLENLPLLKAAQQFGSSQVHEPEFLEIEGYRLVVGESVIAQLSEFIDPGADELTFKLEADCIV